MPEGDDYLQRNSSSKVRRVVITSSAAAVVREDPNPTTFTEADWNDQCLEILKKYEDEGKKNEAPSIAKYRASKTLAERCKYVAYLLWFLVEGLLTGDPRSCLGICEQPGKQTSH